MEDRRQLRLHLQRIARQIDDQHRHLQRFQEELLEARDDAAAATACRRYAEALSGHFDLEERRFFPALHGYEPTTSPDLLRLHDDHSRLRDALDALQQEANAGGPFPRAALTDLLKQLQEHEQTEVALWSSLRARGSWRDE